jgi:hypothetical protein
MTKGDGSKLKGFNLYFPFLTIFKSQQMYKTTMVITTTKVYHYNYSKML